VTPDFQTVVVGAGVIGLAIARALARAGHEVLILEAEDRIGQHTSSRNSGVIHAGLYYPPDSLRARFCVQGRDQLYAYCRSHHVPFEKTGKLVVATQVAQLAGLESLMANARACGVDDLQMVSAVDAQAMEPELACAGAVLSPSTGIVDAPALMLSLQGEAEAGGAVLALGSRLQRVVSLDKGYRLAVGGTELTCENVINAAGHGSREVAKGVDGFPERLVPEQHLAKGHWFSLAGKAPFQRLIYPLSDGASLGVHFTRDLGGGSRFGPDLQFLAQQQVEYGFEAKAAAFEASVSRWWPGISAGQLQPDGCGIRPRITRKGSALSDYLILGAQAHGLRGMVHLFGMESPGLTSCLAIADHVVEVMKG
jgi:L-2-hydroxyglutarate oxidase LhgO